MKQIAQPASRHDKPVTPLSDREIEIIRLLAEGLSNRSVSERLSLSENTIKYHLKNILQKLNVQNRTEAVMYAVRNNLIERP
jgi:DNA-binding NarL/FixJ family response regulator